MTPGRNRPPRLARRALLALAEPRARWQLVDDLDEEFATVAETLGSARAARWYWRQTFRSIPALARRRLRIAIQASRPADAREGRVLPAIGHDLKHELRRARRQPLVTGAVVISIALAVAATAAVFTVVDALLLRPLPLPDAHRLVRVVGVDSHYPESAWGGVSFQNGTDLGERSRTAERVALYNQNWTGSLIIDGEPRSVRYAMAGRGLAETLGIEPELGRSFVAEDHVPGNDRVALLTHDGWVREFGRDPSIVGKTMTLDNLAFTIVGVLSPTRLDFPKEDLAFWVPLAPATDGPAAWRSGRSSPWLQAIARIRPGTSVAQAQAEFDQIGRRLAEDYPETNGSKSYRLVDLQESILGPVRPILALLAGAVAAVLLIASGNVAMLLLAHAQSRRHEFAIRMAVGGVGGRITRQLLTESALLGTLGGGLGLIATPTIIAGFLALYPEHLPRSGEIGVDFRGALVALATTAIASLLATVPSVRQARSRALTEGLRGSDSSRTTRNRAQSYLGGFLIAAQVTFSIVLLFGAALLIRSYWNLTRVDPGFEKDGLLTFWATPNPQRHRSIPEFYRELDGRLRGLPGVTAVATSFDLPTAGRFFQTPIVRAGTDDAPQHQPSVAVQMVSPGYFLTLGIPLVEGRDFDRGDREEGARVMIVNQAFGSRMYPGQSILGRQVTVFDQEHTIVGVVGDARLGLSLWERPEPQMFFPVEQIKQDWRYVVIRAADPRAIAGGVRERVRELDPTLPLAELATLDQRVDRSMGPERFRGLLLGALGGFALVLSLIGIYSVVSYAANRRTQEIGIRLALGEGRSALRRRILRGAMGPAIAGTGLGAMAALGAGRWLQTFVLGVNPRDPTTLLAVAGLFLLVTALAAYGPARRASLLDPARTLRAE